MNRPLKSAKTAARMRVIAKDMLCCGQSKMPLQGICTGLHVGTIPVQEHDQMGRSDLVTASLRAFFKPHTILLAHAACAVMRVPCGPLGTKHIIVLLPAEAAVDLHNDQI